MPVKYLCGGGAGIFRGEWGYLRYNAVISSLQEGNQWSLLASAESERESEHPSVSLTPLSLVHCLKCKTANPVQPGALGFQEHVHRVAVLSLRGPSADITQPLTSVLN